MLRMRQSDKIEKRRGGEKEREMPKSKRRREYNFSKSKKKGTDNKGKQIEALNELINNFESIWVFSIVHASTEFIKEMRLKLEPSKIYLGKNSLVQVAIREFEDTEKRPNLACLSPYLRGKVGILFSNAPPSEVVSVFEGFHESAFAITGQEVSETVELEEGPLTYPVSMASLLAKLGMPVEAKHGELHLSANHRVCTAGDTLSKHQAHLLKLLDKKLGVSAPILLARYSAGELDHQVDVEGVDMEM